MERVIAPLATVAAVALAALALVWLFQRRLIYFPDSRTPGDVRSALSAAEEVRFETADGFGNYNLIGKLTIGFTTDAMYAEKDCPYCQGRGYVTKGTEFINSMQRWFDAHPGASSMIYD